MKLLASLGILCLIFIQTSCRSSKIEENSETENRYTGVIEPVGITTYQYGSHKLKTESSFYALRSDSIDLGIYENQKVSILATKIEGYPVDGGPVYLNVEKVEK